MYLLGELNPLTALLIFILWTAAGWLAISRIDRHALPAGERSLLGLGLGFVSSTWLANWLGRFIPPDAAFWGATLLTLGLGLALAWPLKWENLTTESFPLRPWLFFIFTALLFTLIGRGLGFFDDHQNLPPVSIMATGDIPPHFAFNPDLIFGYHYFLLLAASQLVRLTGAGPWTALDLVRGVTLALTLSYTGFLAYRLTRSRLAQAASITFAAFAGGARWLIFLLPAVLQQKLSASVQLIGSGADTGHNLLSALYKYWQIEGSGPLPFPFAFGSGLDPSFSMFHNGWGTSALTIILLLLLLTGAGLSASAVKSDWFKRRGLPISLILLSSLALANEVTFAFLYLGFAVAALIRVIQKRSLRLSRNLWEWVGLLFVAGLIACLQGGMLTEVATGWLTRIFSPAAAPANTYFRVSFALGLPTVLSAHLGYLSLLNPLQWIAILGETGLAVLALPFVLRQLPALSHEEKWLELAFISSIIISLLMVFVQYTGNAGATAASRMQAHFLSVLKLYAIPLVWLWAKKAKESRQVAAFVWVFASILSGVALFGIQLTAMSNPVYAIYLEPLDAKMFSQQWNKPRPGSMVFDPIYPRAATVLGRPIRSSKTMGETLPEWNRLFETPDPYQLKAAGYDYLYTDQKYLLKHESQIKQQCAVLVDKAEEMKNNQAVDGRYLYDVSQCK